MIGKIGMKNSQAEEDYLKAIYEMTRQEERASTNTIAHRMGVTPASATGMIQKLASLEPPLVDYQKHHGVSLTQTGEKTALEVIRHHRLLETFLLEKLGYSWDEVHEEADRLEHVISENMEERISRSLGDPSFDPHGDPIPDREFHMPAQDGIRMDLLEPGDHAVVLRIDNEDPALLRYLASIGLKLQQEVRVLDVTPYDENFRIALNGRPDPIVLGPRVTSQVIVRVDR
jgi:DtxR family Mn-dependent transcriptional regulator